MQNISDTILSQYSNSQTIVNLINSMNDCIDPTKDIDTFYSAIFDVATAEGYGLDCWGKIVGVSRSIPIVASGQYFGFTTTDSAFLPFGQGMFYAGDLSSGSIALDDASFRTLIMVKAMSNISSPTVPVLNKQLNSLFAGRGRCWVNDIGSMLMTITFTFQLTPVELSILNNSGALIRPAGVKEFNFVFDLYGTIGYNFGGYNTMRYNVTYTGMFGFAEAQGFTGFNNGAMFNSASLGA